MDFSHEYVVPFGFFSVDDQHTAPLVLTKNSRESTYVGIFIEYDPAPGWVREVKNLPEALSVAGKNCYSRVIIRIEILAEESVDFF